MSISSDISSFTAPGSGTMSSSDTGSSNANGSLRLNDGDLINSDSDNVLRR